MRFDMPTDPGPAMQETIAPGMSGQRYVEDWRDSALCHGIKEDLFFGPDEETPQAEHRRVTEAKRMCFACPVRLACLDYATTIEEPYGIWGGLTPAERKYGHERCSNGHILDDVYTEPGGKRRCRKCRKERARELRKRRSA